MRINQKLHSLLRVLFDEKVIIDVMDKGGMFYDEPPFHHFVALKNKEYNYYNKKAWDYSGQSVSLESREMALLKCLIELVEKVSLNLFEKKKIKYIKYNKVSPFNLQLDQYINSFHHKKRQAHEDATYGSVVSKNLFTKKDGFVPAQLIYPNYYQYSYFDRGVEEPALIYQRQVLNGAAADFDENSALLRAINEVIERDAFATLHFTKHIPKAIDLKEFNHSKINGVLDILLRYNLQVNVFDITNDLGIPVFMTVLIDKTGIGPFVNLGCRAGLNIQEAMFSSIEDALYSRYCIRQDLVMNTNTEYYKHIKNIKLRGLNYEGPVTVKKLTWELIEYMFQKKFQQQNRAGHPYPKVTKKDYFNYTCEQIRENGYEIWYKKLTNNITSKLNLNVIKVLIPGLQPPIIKHEYNNIYQGRLKKAMSHYHSLP